MIRLFLKIGSFYKPITFSESEGLLGLRRECLAVEKARCWDSGKARLAKPITTKNPIFQLLKCRKLAQAFP